MSSAYNKLKDYIKQIEIEYLDYASLEKAIYSFELKDEVFDLDENVNCNSKEADETFFVLNYLYMYGFEYYCTLGYFKLSYYDYFDFNSIYYSSAVCCYDLIRASTHNHINYVIPNKDIKESLNSDYNYNFIEIQKNILEFLKTFSLINLKKVLFLIDKNLESKKYDRVCNLSLYDSYHLIHSQSTGLSKLFKIPKTIDVLLDIKKDFKIIENYFQVKNKFNFLLRNRKKVRRLLVPFKGLCIKYTCEPFDYIYLKLFFLDLTLLEDQIDKINLIGNKYIQFYSIYTYFLILKDSKMMEPVEEKSWYLFFIDMIEIHFEGRFHDQKTVFFKNKLIGYKKYKGLMNHRIQKFFPLII